MLAVTVCSWPWNFHWDLVIHQWINVSCHIRQGTQPWGQTWSFASGSHSSFISCHNLPLTTLYIHRNKLLLVPQKHYILSCLSLFQSPPPPPVLLTGIPKPSVQPSSLPIQPLQPSSLPSIPKPDASALPESPQYGTYHTCCHPFTSRLPF